MRTPVELQLWRVAVLCLSGILYNIIFQVYTALRAVALPGKITRHVLDGLMAVLILLILGCVIFYVNYGEMRLYIPVSLGSGFLFANALVGKITYSKSLAVFRTVRKSFLKVKSVMRSAAIFVKQKLLLPIKNFLFPPEPPDDPYTS